MSNAIENGVSIGILALNNYEPKAKWRWKLQVHAPSFMGDTRPFTFMVKTSGRPELGVEVMTTTHINEYRNFVGKPIKPPDYSTSFVDGIVLPGGGGSNVVPRNGTLTGSPVDTASLLYGWYSTMYNPETGAGNYANAYKGAIVIQMLDPQLTVQEEWTGFGAFPSKIALGELDYESTTDKCMTDVTWSLDVWKKGNVLGVGGGFLSGLF